MGKINLQVQGIELITKAEVPQYIPFANGEIITGACFDVPTGYSFKVVEGFEEIANAEKDCKLADFGNIKTVCLIITTTKDSELTILTLNK